MQRILTALLLLAASFFLVYRASAGVFAAAAVLTGCLCYYEYSSIVAAHDVPRPLWLGIVGGILILLLPQYTLATIAILLIAVMTVALRLDDLTAVLAHSAATIFGVIYTFAPWRFAIDLRQQSVHILFFALSLNWAGDTLAYYVGRSFGKHRLAPSVSPKKSWEGAAAAVVGSLVFGTVYLRCFVPAIPWWQAALLAMAGNVAGQFGDLAESAIKRGAGVKDSGTMLPGHGGILDRLDSSLFSLPAVYVLLTLFQTAKTYQFSQ